MLPSTILQYPLSLGLNEGVDDKTAPPGTLSRAQNVVWKKSNLLEKRFGTETIPSDIDEVGGTDMSSGKRIFVRGDELCVATTDGDLYGFASGQDYWKNKGQVPAEGLTWKTAIDTTSGVQSSDMARSGSIEVRAWVNGDPARESALPSSGSNIAGVEIIDHESGDVLSAPLPGFANGYCFGVRVLIVDGAAVILTRDGGASPFGITAVSYNLTTYARTGPTAIVVGDVLAGGDSLAGWDACVIGTTFVVAWGGAGPQINLAAFDNALVAGATGTMTDASGCNMISIAGTTGESLYVLYGQNGAYPRSVYLGIADPDTLAETVPPILVETAATAAPIAVSVCQYDASNCVIAYVISDTASSYLTTHKADNTGNVVLDTGRRTYWMSHVTRPFMVGSKCYIAAVSRDYVFNYNGGSSGLFEVDVSNNGSFSYLPHRLVGAVDVLIASDLCWAAPRPDPVVVSSTEAKVLLPCLDAVPTIRRNWLSGVRLVTLTRGNSRPIDWCRPASYGEEVFVVGGQLSVFDGRDVFDYGFFQRPAHSVATSAAGGSIAAGVYNYAVHLEYRSRPGVLYRSAPSYSDAVTTTGATSTNTVSAGTFSVGNKQKAEGSLASFTYVRNPTSARVYRTIVNGSIRQRLTAEPEFNTVAAPPDAGLATLSDTKADANIAGGGVTLTLASRPAMYTEGGVLPDDQPPSAVTQFYSVDRLWLLSGDELTWWYSKKFQDDLGVAPGFSPSFRQIFPKRQVAGAGMDEKTVFFSEDEIWFLQGQGPAPDGSGSDFSGPFKIQTDSGCTNPRSVVSMPDGIMFEGSGDIFLLTRSLEVQWIGKPVKDQLEAYPTITSAVLLTKRNEIRFSCNDSTGENGIVLVYNYAEKQWSTSVYSSATNDTTAIADACVWQDLYTFLTPVGQVYREDEDTHLDLGTKWVTMDVETTENYAEGPLSYQRVRRAYLKGEFLTDCGVTLRVAVNGEDSYRQTKEFSSATMKAIGTAKIGTHIKAQKSDSIRLRITDSFPASLGLVLGTGQGINLSAIGFEIAPKKGMDKRAAEARK